MTRFILVDEADNFVFKSSADPEVSEQLYGKFTGSFTLILLLLSELLELRSENGKRRRCNFRFIKPICP